ncbi:hypothetical protein GCM10009718_27830 [Isoptericola halotolerans]|uniref:Choice-of-anchor A domain-containing protein n=1 Tax=Isoptericola halotolerans TaxID=300560 RepID=A0ABX2A6E4_9MICO|nr:choice-of-anchor A domain-containing protein [Isoptericola halotolerans]
MNSPDRRRTPSHRTRRRVARTAAPLGLALTLSTLAVPAGAATTQVDPFDLAGGFSVYARGDAQLTNHETEGAIAVGGELTVRADGGTYPVIHQAAGTADYTIPTVDGDPTRLLIGSYAPTSGLAKVENKGVPAGSGPELEGYLKVVGDDPAFDTYQRADWTRYRTAVDDAPAIDATNQAWPDGADTVATENGSVASYVESGPGVDAVRQCLAQLGDSDLAHRLDVAEDVGDRVVLSAIEPGVPNVVDYADIADASLVQFADGTLPSADAPLIISVPAGTTELSGKVFGTEGQVARYVMWDLSQHDGAVTLDGSGTRVDGSVYAPDADLTLSAAPIDGQIVAGSLDLRGGEAHAYLFAGSLPCGSEPVAATGSISLTKAVEGDGSADVPAETEYSVSYAVDGGEEVTLTMTVGETETIDELTAGSTVTLTEPGFPEIDEVTWGAPRWQVDGLEAGAADGSLDVEIREDTAVEVVLTNTAEGSAEPTPTPTPETPTEEPTDEPSEPSDGASQPAPTTPADLDDPDRTPEQSVTPVVDDSTDGLPVTGPQIAGIALTAALLLGAGILLVLRRRGVV